MSTFRILPRGDDFQAVETNGAAGTLTVLPFDTRAKARKWILARIDELGRDEQPGFAEIGEATYYRAGITGMYLSGLLAT
jgi:hypothetical protein